MPWIGAVGARAAAIGQQMVYEVQHPVAVIAVAMQQAGGAMQELAGERVGKRLKHLLGRLPARQHTTRTLKLSRLERLAALMK